MNALALSSLKLHFKIIINRGNFTYARNGNKGILEASLKYWV